MAVSKKWILLYYQSHYSFRTTFIRNQDILSILSGMRHFIPNKSDLTYFNTFLKSNDVEDIGSSRLVLKEIWKVDKIVAFPDYSIFSILCVQ